MAAEHMYWRRWPLVTDRQRGWGALYAISMAGNHLLSIS